ncbi:DUF6228 family protein [Streptomyces sp. NPDC002908]|uniref:DUF6228 family protein n=1 Tax=Streptomyces sp. NPDC002908 TaxID=3364670 RepID=UPI0036A1E945
MTSLVYEEPYGPVTPLREGDARWDPFWCAGLIDVTDPTEFWGLKLFLLGDDLPPHRGVQGRRLRHPVPVGSGRLVAAVFRPGGNVGLTWPVRPWPQSSGGWNASVTTWLEGGEQMATLAAGTRCFLAGEQQ